MMAILNNRLGNVTLIFYLSQAFLNGNCLGSQKTAASPTTRGFSGLEIRGLATGLPSVGVHQTTGVNIRSFTFIYRPNIRTVSTKLADSSPSGLQPDATCRHVNTLPQIKRAEWNHVYKDVPVGLRRVMIIEYRLVQTLHLIDEF